MPSRFLDGIGNPFIIAGHPAGCLVAAGTSEKIGTQNGIRGFVECHVRDRTGRFVIPSALREFADLRESGEAAVIGVGDEVEIWNKRRWENNSRLAQQPEGPKPTSTFTLRNVGGSMAPPTLPFVGIKQKSLYGQPFLQIDGALTLSETDRVLSRLETALRANPRTIFLDLRNVDTVDAAFLIAMEPAARQLAFSGGRMAILTERQDIANLIHRLCGPGYTRVFSNLEAALWWLVEEGNA